MLQLPNFEPGDKTVGGVMDQNYDVKTFISKHLYFKKAWSSQF